MLINVYILFSNPSNQTAKTAVNAFAKLLANRYNAVVGATRSWDTADPTDFQVCLHHAKSNNLLTSSLKVIIDNMMNLEVLFHAETLTGNSTFRKIAIAHADTTMKNHIRTDGWRFPSRNKKKSFTLLFMILGSTWHVIEYNSTTGAVIKKRTAQGFSDSR